MMKFIFLFAIFTFSLSTLTAQNYKHYSVFSSAGKWHSNSSYGHYFVLGESIVKDFVAIDSYKTSIGFLSPDTIHRSTGDGVVEQDSRLTIFPNPTKDVLYIKSEKPEYESLEIRVLNILGEEMLFHKLSPGEIITEQIKFENFPQGFYLLKITGADKMSVYKVIKE